ncbi:MAG TPA: cellulose binding domain-containing protein [Micromonosporaceae bacterium]|nr:cellulose binding domain-containing protein [Micromonosporaceae bacterium]
MRTIARILTAAVLGTTALVVASAPAAHAATTCAVTYNQGPNWGSGFSATLYLTPGVAVTSWRVDFDVEDQQVITAAHYANLVQTGRHVTLTNLSFNGTIPAGLSTQVLLMFVNPTGTNAPPPSFVINGQTCTYTPQPQILTSVHTFTVPEGGSATVAVRLSRAPTVDIQVRVWSSSSGTVFTAGPSMLTFTPANWNVPQTVTVLAAEDADAVDNSGWVPLTQNNFTPQMYAAYVAKPVQDDND